MRKTVFVLFPALVCMAVSAALSAGEPKQLAAKLEKQIPVELEYLVYLPEDYDQKDAWPLGDTIGNGRATSIRAARDGKFPPAFRDVLTDEGAEPLQLPPRSPNLTAYVETVGDGVDAYEDTNSYLDAEMEEFSFFLSAFEFLGEKDKPGLMNTTFQTIALEIRNHKWELQDYSVMPVMERLAEIMDEAYAANLGGQRRLVREKIDEYRDLYAKNINRLR